jgi:CheY-like chemotaxis protein
VWAAALFLPSQNDKSMKKTLNCVLLVDDDECDNFFHRRVIAKAGICNHIEIAINGKEALDFLTNKGRNTQSENSFFQPELIFLDLNMPVMDGWKFLEEYQKHDNIDKKNTVIIILSTSINPADKLKAEQLVGNGRFEYKPLTLEMINRILKEHFPDCLNAGLS